jgi:putative FmdB family regulatory protein
MPSYEYHCQTCDREFVVSMSLHEHDTADVRCPACQGMEVKQVFSSFVAVTSKKS